VRVKDRVGVKEGVFEGVLVPVAVNVVVVVALPVPVGVLEAVGVPVSVAEAVAESVRVDEVEPVPERVPEPVGVPVSVGVREALGGTAGLAPPLHVYAAGQGAPAVEFAVAKQAKPGAAVQGRHALHEKPPVYEPAGHAEQPAPATA
jgi:hypothetical protein